MQASQRRRVEDVVPSPQRFRQNAGNERLRPLTVEEALQYTPLTTSTLSAHDRIPLPEFSRARTASRITSNGERRAIRKTIESVSRDQQSLQEVKQQLVTLLDKNALPEFTFKSRRLSSQPSSSIPQTGPPAAASGYQLSPLASMILKSTDVAWRLPSPSSPTTPSPKLPNYRSLPTPALSISPKPTPTTNVNFRQNALVSPTGGQLVPSILIPPLPQSARREDFVVIPDSPKRRKLDHKSDVALHIRSQREQSDAMLTKFEELLMEIFEAQDRYEPDTSTAPTDLSGSFFDAIDEDDEESTIWLSSKIHSKLQNMVKKLVDWKRFRDVSAEYVRRLQNLCELSTSAAQSLQLRIPESDEEEIVRWQTNLSKAEKGSTSACTVVWTILGSLHDESLIPEDFMRSLPILLVNLFEDLLIPIIEARPASKSSHVFQQAAATKEKVTRLLSQGRKLLNLSAMLCAEVNEAQFAVNAIETLSTKLLFVEISPNERDSVLERRMIEELQKTAMEALARIFAKFPDERSHITDGLLTSLDKLPATSRKARQFKLGDGKSIQLVSALIMQLVQTTAIETPQQRIAKLRRSNAEEGVDNDNSDDDRRINEEHDKDSSDGDDEGTITKLCSKIDILNSRSNEIGQYMVNFLVEKAKTSTKTGDQPHRLILDSFVEDLLSVLGSPEWPAANLLLRILAIYMIHLTKDEKSSAIARNMALEHLGWMGSAISNLQASVASLATVATQDHDLVVANRLADLSDDQCNGGARLEDVIAVDGPYQLTLDHLQSLANPTLSVQGARGLYLFQWAKAVSSTLKWDDFDEQDGNIDPTVQALADRLFELMSDPLPFGQESNFGEVNSQQARLAYTITVLSSGFCKLFPTIVMVLLASIKSDQARSVSRSIKSVESMLETDPSLLDRDPTIIHAIFRCASDKSSMVRDSALALIAKCMSLKPALEADACKIILQCSADPMVGVRKRCIALLKDIYKRDSSSALKSIIAKSFLERSTDHESSVSDLAVQSLVDIWITPFLQASSASTESAQVKVFVSRQSSLVVQTLAQDKEALAVLVERFFRSVTKVESKTANAALEFCANMVSSLFDELVNSVNTLSNSYLEGLLLTLTALAKADARTIASEHLKTLRPYISNLATTDDLLFFRSVVTIYRCVLPQLSSTHRTLLEEIQNDLFRAISKLARNELNEVMACLWTINGVLENTARLVKLAISVLRGIASEKASMAKAALADPTVSQTADYSRLKSYIRIAGAIGKYCDLETYQNAFKKDLPDWKGVSVAGYIATVIEPLTHANQQLSLRAMALESLGSICQSWPIQFDKVEIKQSFLKVFEEDSLELQSIVLKTFTDFFGIREGAKEVSLDIDDAGEQDLSTLGGSTKVSHLDSAAALIPQHFLQPIIGLALSSQDRNTLVAIKIIASINRQGLVHPKQCASVLVALETNPDPEIAKVAFDSHLLMHQQHEGPFEREYIRAVHEAFRYQKNVIGDDAGATIRPFKAKLGPLFDVVKTSNSKYIKRFLTNLVSRTILEPSKEDDKSSVPENLLLSRFTMQNLAFFEFDKAEELLHAILQLELFVGKAGSELIQTIEAEMGDSLATGTDLKMEIDELQETNIGFADPATPNGDAKRENRIDSASLRRLTIAAMVLTLLWETRSHLKRQYGVTQDVRHVINRNKETKETVKGPSRVHGVTGEKFWDRVSAIMSSLSTRETMLARCEEFSALMAIDEDVRVAAEDEAMRDSASVDGDLGRANGSTLKSARSRKRKSATPSIGGTPKKKRSRPSSTSHGRPSSRGSSKSNDSGDEWGGG